MFLIKIISQVLGQTIIPVNIVDAKPRTEPRTSATLRGVDECQGTLRWEREDFKGAVRWDREESKGTLSATAVKAYIEGMDDFEDSDDDEAVSVTDEEEGASSFSGVLLLPLRASEGHSPFSNTLPRPAICSSWASDIRWTLFTVMFSDCFWAFGATYSTTRIAMSG